MLMTTSATFIIILLATTPAISEMSTHNSYRSPCSASATQAHTGDIAIAYSQPRGTRERRGATAIRERLWPGGRVPYTMSSRYNDDEERVIKSAMMHWENNTCIRFVPRTNETSYIWIFPGSGCCSYVGRQSPNFEQGVSIGRGCMSFATAVHEFGHAIGYWHEQSRPDRDEFITVIRENIPNSHLPNFDKLTEEKINSLGVGYDYNSIMHYNNDTFGGGKATIVANDPSIPVGMAVELSDLDILQTNLLYSCDMRNPPPMETSIPPLNPVKMPPLPTCGEEFINQYTGNFHSPGYPTYTHNQDCAWRIIVPEGMTLTITIILLNIEWARNCKEKDYLVIYNSVDGSGHPQLYPICGWGSGREVVMEGHTAYVIYHTDDSNVEDWGEEGFNATFLAEDINECEHHNGGCTQECRNLEGGYTCACRPGWYLSGDLRTCFDVNECARGNGGCQHKCVNSGGSFKCECPYGTKVNSDGRTCSIANATCDENNGGCEQVCSESPGTGVSCHCMAGYRLNTDGLTCRDIDECFEDTHSCTYGGCINTPGGYNCTCPAGYKLDSNGTICINIDECELGLYTCRDGECRDTNGSYECICHPGFTLSSGNRHQCIDIDECLNLTICSHNCHNTPGSYYCTCDTGYYLDGGRECVDFDECSTGACTGEPGLICKNTPGSFICLCTTGYEPGSLENTCQNVDECERGTANCEHECADTEGSFTCSCRLGYTLSPDGHSCVINCGGVMNTERGGFSSPGYPVSYPKEKFECEWIIQLPHNSCIIQFTFQSPYGILGSGNCPNDYIQIYDGIESDSSSLGKYCYLTLPDPVTSSSSQARVKFYSTGLRRPISRMGVNVSYTAITIVNECLIDKGGCEQICTDTTSSFECHCYAGYRLASDGRTCEDIDECSSGLHNCQQGCSNSNGSYTCTCDYGYTLGEDGSSCVCGGTLTRPYGDFATPNWPTSYPQENFKCEWTIELPDNQSIIEFSIDKSAYGIDGRWPCTKDYIEFRDGTDRSSSIIHKLCQYHNPGNFTTTTSQTRVVFAGSINKNRPSGRVGVHVFYNTVNANHVTPKPRVNECLHDNGGCQHTCVDTEESYYCECPDGYMLDTDKRSCRCGGKFTESEGSFETPGWPNSYPQENFACEWTIHSSNESKRISLTVDRTHYGINGRPPCNTDYLQFHDGLDTSSNVIGGKYCYVNAPSAPILSSSNGASVVFVGSKNSHRPVSRVGVKVNYRFV